MAAVRRFLRRLIAFLRPERAERELDRELRAHLALIEEDAQARGTPADRASEAARRALGDLERTRDLHRDARSFVWLDDARRDARYAVRTLIRQPGFTTVVVLTLGLGIAGVTTMFAGLDAILFRAAPFPDPERLVLVNEVIGDRRAGVTAPDWLDWQRSQHAFSSMAAYANTTVTLTGVDDPQRLPARRVSARYFRTLGIPPAIGRDFTEADDALGAPGTVLVSDALWRSRFQGDPTLVGRTIELDGVSRMVIGVLPPGINLAERTEQFYVPLAVTEDERQATGSHFLLVLGRLSPGLTVTQAAAAMAPIAAAIAQVRPHSNRDVTVRLEDLRERLIQSLRQPLWFFTGAVCLLLVIVCANVANLQLVRTTARLREVAVRVAIGAGRGRLVRQFAMESIVLGIAGGAAGWLLAWWSSDLLPWLIPDARPRLAARGFDLRPAAFATLAGLTTGIVVGLAPAWTVARRDVRSMLQRASRGTTGVDRHRITAALVVIETALALVLLVGAGLMMRSVMRLQAIDPGLQTDGVFAARIALPESRYGQPEQAVAFFEALRERTGVLPGVMAAGGTSSLPLRESGSSLVATIEGRPRPTRMADFPRFFYRGVTPGYFSVLRIPVLAGRDISPADRAGRPRVGIINRTAAVRYWPNASAVGARIEPDDNGDVLEIVGVVADVRHFGLGEDTSPELFIAMAQAPAPYWRWTQRTLDFVARTAPGQEDTLAGPIRGVMRELDPSLALSQVAAMNVVVDESLAAPKHTLILLVACAVMALLLAALGTYGVVASAVRGRTQEIGVRVALGASRRDVLALLLGSSLRLCAIGLVAGAVVAFSLRTVIAGFLFGVASTDAATYAGVAVALLLTTLAASLVPARRALRVDPVRTLRMD